MKVAVLGGYGVFGSRLCRLLLRDGHDVVVVGRRAAAASALASEIGAQSLQLDREGALTPLWAIGPDVVIDCAGPFHGYGASPYRLAEDAIAQGVHYMDLADDAAFCAGIAALDAKAKAAGVFVLSGMSSVPALSSAVVTALIADAEEVDCIQSAILPGNKAPRGQAVVDSILYQAGTDIDVMIDGQITQVQSWSDGRLFDLPGGIRRRGYAIRVPDHALFPAHFNARSVIFHAGLEVGVMNHGLAAFAWVRHKLGFAIPQWLAKTFRSAAQMLLWAGTDVGGMVVRVVVKDQGVWSARSWRLLAREGDGPYIPAISARTVLRAPADIAPGARAGLAEFSLEAAEAAMGDLAVKTETETAPLTPVFQRVLGPAFDRLAPAVRQSHLTYGPRIWSGHAKITRGAGLWPRLIAALIGFPPAAQDVPVTVTKTPDDKGETWVRRFGAQTFLSHLREGPHGMTETFGPLTFDLGLQVENGQLFFPVNAGRCLGFPLPKWFMPQSEAAEREKDGQFTFDVAIKAPLTGQLIVHYQGALTREK